MYYKLTNGDKIFLSSNLSKARFVYLVMPFQSVKFDEGVEKPQIIMNNDVTKVINVAERFKSRLGKFKVRTSFKDELPDFDDDIPF